MTDRRTEHDARRSASIVRLRLTQEQRAHLERENGFTIATVEASRATFAAMAMAGDQHGAASALSTDAVLVLTAEQRDLLRSEGIDASVLAFSPRPTVWKDNWSTPEPFELCPGLTVAMGGAGDEPPPGGAMVTLLPDPSGDNVFGSGRHPVTVLAARLLASVIVPGASVADIGTGSGILAMVACRLGAARVTAVDIDERAVDAARRNATANGLDASVDVRLGDVGAATDGPYDVVTANLFPAILIEERARLAAVTAPSGSLILSGVVSPRMPDVAAAMRASGLAEGPRASAMGWTAQLFRQPAA